MCGHLPIRLQTQERGLNLWVTEGGKEGKSKSITSFKYLEEKGVALATSVETLGVVGSEEKARSKKCKNT